MKQCLPIPFSIKSKFIVIPCQSGELFSTTKKKSYVVISLELSLNRLGTAGLIKFLKSIDLKFKKKLRMVSIRA